MQRLISLGLALLLAIESGATQAGRGHGDRHHGGHGHGHKHKHGHHRDHWYPRPHHTRVYYYPRHDYDHDYYYPLGAALIGAAISYSLYHAHDGVRCYESHGTSYSAPSVRTEVVGCHRIERYPDGSERRVEVPTSECY